MKEFIKDFFEKERIEYYAALSYSDMKRINERLIEREKFDPRSVIVFLIPYYSRDGENISRYAVARDYHIFIKELAARFESVMKTAYPQYSFKGYGDHSPIDERYAALVGGLGVLGDNGLIINEKYGSYIFISEIITDAPCELVGAVGISEIARCERCGACVKKCPTGALSDFSLDCLSSITQRKGELADSEIELMKKYNTVWGCDECQAACPHNRDPIKTPIEFFKSDIITRLDKNTLDSMDDEKFRERAYAWRGRKTVERNIEKTR